MVIEKRVLGMVARPGSACVLEFVSFFKQNWTSARQNQMEALMVENIGSLKWWVDGGVAAGEQVSDGEEASASIGMMKARSSTPGLPM